MSIVAALLLLHAPVPDPQAIPTPAGYKLIWNDEFDRPGLPDPKKWGYEEGYVRNSEAQFYTKADPRTARVQNGMLTITATKMSGAKPEIVSAALITKGKRNFLYGRIEIRAKVPPGRGSWPALWMLGSNIDRVGWAKCGEIDIMEYVGKDPNNVYTTYHFGNPEKSSHHPVDAPNFADAFHTYTFDWEKDSLACRIDGESVGTYRKPANATDDDWPFDKPEYLLINLAIGGSWGGQKGIDDAIFPAKFKVDYVRYYQKR